MQAVFRVDASAQIGSGHLMRCLTLAEGLRRRGAAVQFICRAHDGNLIALLEQKGFAVHSLPNTISKPRPDDVDPHESWLGADWETDASQSEAILQRVGKVDWLIIDHYSLDVRWEARLRHWARRVMVIDDLANRPHDCDVLLDQNFYLHMDRRYDALVPPTCRQFLGPKYALLREEFTRHQAAPRGNGTTGRILVYFGATDPTGETLKVLSALERLGPSEREIDVVVGVSNPHAPEIKRLATRISRCRVLDYVENMAELIAGADLALGAGGTTTWERCFFGVPSIVISIAQNQEKASADLAEAGYILYLGRHDEVTTDLLYHLLKAFLQSTTWRNTVRRRCSELVDGRGVGRVLDALLPPDIQLREAQLRDCESLHEWRNAEETRRYIFNPAPIDFETHRRWFLQTLDDPSRVLLIGEQAGEPVGVLRYDLSGETAVISVYLVPGKQRQGIGTALIRAGSDWIFRHRDAHTIEAKVLEANTASMAAFLKAGFRKEVLTLIERSTHE